AGRKDAAVELEERAAHPVLLDQPGDGRRLAARHGEAVETLEVDAVPYGDHRRVVARPLVEGRLKGGDVLAHIALESEHTDPEPGFTVHGTGAPRSRAGCERRGRAWRNRAPSRSRRAGPGRRGGRRPRRSPSPSVPV